MDKKVEQRDRNYINDTVLPVSRAAQTLGSTSLITFMSITYRVNFNNLLAICQKAVQSFCFSFGEPSLATAIFASQQHLICARITLENTLVVVVIVATVRCPTPLTISCIIISYVCVYIIRKCARANCQHWCGGNSNGQMP